MRKNARTLVLGYGPLVAAIVATVVLYIYVSPRQLLAYLGTGNALLVMFGSAFVGGLTTLNVIPYHTVLIFLVLAGVSPLQVGVAAGIGVAVGDTYSYFIGRQGATVLPRRWLRFFDRVRHFAEAHPRLFPLLCFLYGTFTPFSNDLVMIPAGLARIPLWQALVPLALGNLLFDIGLAYLTIYAQPFVQNLFAVYS